MEQWLVENLGSDGSHLSGGIRLLIVLIIIVVSFIAYFVVKYAVIPIIQKIFAFVNNGACYCIFFPIPL